MAMRFQITLREALLLVILAGVLLGTYKWWATARTVHRRCAQCGSTMFADSYVRFPDDVFVREWSCPKCKMHFEEREKRN